MTAPQQARAALEKVCEIHRLCDAASKWQNNDAIGIVRPKIRTLAREAAALLAPQPSAPAAVLPSIGDDVWWIVFGRGYAGVVTGWDGRDVLVHQTHGVPQSAGPDWKLLPSLVHRVEPAPSAAVLPEPVDVEALTAQYARLVVLRLTGFDQPNHCRDTRECLTAFLAALRRVQPSQTGSPEGAKGSAATSQAVRAQATEQPDSAPTGLHDAQEPA